MCLLTILPVNDASAVSYTTFAYPMLSVSNKVRRPRVIPGLGNSMVIPIWLSVNVKLPSQLGLLK